jgi:hypothetical protein
MRETPSLKALAFKALERLERNKTRNKSETKDENLVSHLLPRETKNNAVSTPVLTHSSSPIDAYEERVAIAHYEGRQSIMQATRIAYLDNLMDVLRTLPYSDNEERDQGDWLKQRIKETQEWLLAQGIEQPK